MTKPIGERTTKIPDGSEGPTKFIIDASPSKAPSVEAIARATATPTVDDPILMMLLRQQTPPCPKAIAPLQQSKRGGSGAFLVSADDGKRYWCKGTDNLQSPRVPINEQIVGRIGKLIGAAVCDVSLIFIPPELDSHWEYRPGQKLRTGYVHGSLAVENALETRDLAFINDDDNARRQTSLGVLADLCWANDTQWLYATADENRYFSHDHGHYFPGGPRWTIRTLRSNPPDERAPRSELFPKFREDVLQQINDRLVVLDALGIAKALAGLPLDWHISDEELVEMVMFLDRRRVGVIQRLHASLSLAKGSAV